MDGLLRPGSTSIIVTKMINYTVSRGIVDGLKRPRSTSTIVTTIINFAISRERVACLKIPLSTYFKDYILWISIVVTMTGQRISGIKIPIYKNSITTHREINFFADWVGPALLVWSMAPGNEMHLKLGLNCFRCSVSMMYWTGLLQGSGAQWRWIQVLDDWALPGVDLDSIISIISIRAPLGDRLLAGIMLLQR